MVAVSKLLTACVALGSTVSWPLSSNPRELQSLPRGIKTSQPLLMSFVVLMVNSYGISAPAARSEVYAETPDTMGAGVDRIRRSEESASEESKATPDIMWNPRHSVESVDISNVD